MKKRLKTTKFLEFFSNRLRLVIISEITDISLINDMILKEGTIGPSILHKVPKVFPIKNYK